MMKTSIFSKMQKTDCLIVAVFESEKLDAQLKDLDKQFEGFLSRVIASKDFDGKRGQMNLLYVQNKEVTRVMLVGLGKEQDTDIRRWKNTIGAAVISLQGKKIENIALAFPEYLKEKYGALVLARETLIAAEIADYSYDEYKQSDSRVTPIKNLDIIEVKEKLQKEIQKGLNEGAVIAHATNNTRHLGNTPPHIMTPAYLAQEAKKLEKVSDKVKVKILSQKEIEKLKMGCFLGVAQGSVLEPKFIIIEYRAGRATEKPTVLVGKGITFDSGGISLKPGDYLMDMKFDMLGGATVIGIIQSLAGLGIKKNIIGLIPACENMPSGNAYRPDDILVAMNGLSVEVVNTDAEGRMILSDALCYAARYNPKEVIDFATLTGHCMIALGNERSGLFTKNEKISEGIIHSSKTVGEQIWPLPLGEEFTEGVKSDVADLKNGGGVGGSRYGGASIGAAFLEHFTSYPWAHIDLSCSHYGSHKAWVRKGANGFGVQMMVEYLRK